MIEIPGDPVDVRQFSGLLLPKEVLYHFDGPRIFVAEGSMGGALLVYQFYEDPEGVCLVTVPTGAETIGKLKAGHLDLLGALQQPWVWIVKMSHGGSIEAAKRTEIAQIPADLLPFPGTMLWPELEPLITVRLTGPTIREGEVPGSVIARAIEAATTAFRALLDTTGSLLKVPELRRLLDLRAQQIRYGSFEVSFREPAGIQETAFIGATEDRAIERMGGALLKGLVWLSAIDQGWPADISDEEKRSILQALDALAPPATGVVTDVELGGRIVAPFKRRVRLNRQHRALIKRAFSAPLPTEATSAAGLVRAIDLDKHVVTLRDTDQQLACRYEDAQLPSLLRALSGEERVSVVAAPRTGKQGQTRPGQLQLISIEPESE